MTLLLIAAGLIAAWILVLLVVAAMAIDFYRSAKRVEARRFVTPRQVADDDYWSRVRHG